MIWHWGCFEKQDLALAETIEPLEEVVDQMQETLKDRHINRLRNGQCTVDAAFPFVESLSCLSGSPTTAPTSACI